MIQIISAILYRIPRGGGLGEGRSTMGALIWAGVTGILNAVWLSHWVPLALIPVLMLGEAPGWSKWWPNNTAHVRNASARMWALNARGMLLLNPFMGFIYFWCYGHRNDLPRLGKLASGWTEWAELACGFVTALAFSWVCWVLV